MERVFYWSKKSDKYIDYNYRKHTSYIFYILWYCNNVNNKTWKRIYSEDC